MMLRLPLPIIYAAATTLCTDITNAGLEDELKLRYRLFEIGDHLSMPRRSVPSLCVVFVWIFFWRNKMLKREYVYLQASMYEEW